MTLEPNFKTTLLAARSGADWAWTAVYREFAPQLLRYISARGAPNPQDTLGDVFVQVVRKLPSFSGSESQFKAWLFTIARNRLIDEARSRDRRPAAAPLHAQIEPSLEQRGDLAPPSSLTHRQVEEVLECLTHQQREVLFLRVLAGLTIEETAQVLGKSDGSVKRLQSRGLRALRGKIVNGVVSL